MFEIGLGTNEKIFPAVLCAFQSRLVPLIPILETTPDYARGKTDLARRLTPPRKVREISGLTVVKQHPHKSPHTGCLASDSWVWKCLKSLAPQVRHRSDLSNGEFRRRRFLDGVNQARILGDAFGFDGNLAWPGWFCRMAPKNHGFRLPLRPVGTLISAPKLDQGLPAETLGPA